jgi:hypothetical protein
VQGERDRPDAWQQSILAAATVHDLRAAADQTAELLRVLEELPVIADSNLTEREAALAMLVWRKTDAARKLMRLLFGNPDSQWI